MILLIHGGLWDDMDAEGFWHRPGIVAHLRRRGIEVLAPDRPPRASSWAAEVEQLSAVLPDGRVTVVAGSNGCSAAVRLTFALPDRIERLLLAWPATAGDPRVDARTRQGLTEIGATPHVVDALLAGDTLRGVTDEELAGIATRVGVLPAVPENPFHQRRTVDALLRTIPGAVELPGCPEPPRPEFAPVSSSFINTVVAFAGMERRVPGSPSNPGTRRTGQA